MCAALDAVVFFLHVDFHCIIIMKQLEYEWIIVFSVEYQKHINATLPEEKSYHQLDVWKSSEGVNCWLCCCMSVINYLNSQRCLDNDSIHCAFYWVSIVFLLVCDGPICEGNNCRHGYTADIKIINIKFKLHLHVNNLFGYCLWGSNIFPLLHFPKGLFLSDVIFHYDYYIFIFRKSNAWGHRKWNLLVWACLDNFNISPDLVRSHPKEQKVRNMEQTM